MKQKNIILSFDKNTHAIKNPKNTFFKKMLNNLESWLLWGWDTDYTNYMQEKKD